MRKTALSLFLICAGLISLIPVTAAQAACRPTTLADYPAPGATPPVAPSPSIPPTTAPPTETTTTPTPETTTASAPVTAAPRVARCSFVYRIQWPILGGGAVGSVFAA